MDEQHNELMKFVLDEPEEAAWEIARLREDVKRFDFPSVVLAFLIGLLCGLWFG